MSSAAAGSGPGTAHEPAMQQQQQQQQLEVVVAAAELPVPAPAPGSVLLAAAEAPSPAPGSVVVAAAEVASPAPASVVVAAAEVPPLAPAPGEVVTIVISRPEEVALEPKGVAPDSPAPLEPGGDSAMAAVAAAKEAELARSDSFDEQCRVCQQNTEEPLVDLGCRCRGDLSRAHRTCIDVWFRTRGSNKCEICQQVAVNIPPPETQASGWFSPLWVAFAILIGGLLLDVLISVSLGVSALPVNIIIGVLIVLGLGTALRLALECCQEFGSRRSMPRMENMAPSGYHPGV